ncbi:MAG: metalloregulator ArsR/SmtB family transcription factor [Pseudomonadales bacterium]|nr:metalloregulator ArsR/SmtB family transcription factor [Pseudomonadales bacterium]NRA13982.1 winged helix-turn-helix transcriptional regulator [Oceanospirillaceae bacterium]
MIDSSKLAANSAKAVTLLKALANKQRLMILCALQGGELSVSQLNELIPIPQSSLSQQLAWLRKEQFVQTRREAQSIFYALDSWEVQQLINTLHQIYCSDDQLQK